jgi:hypothetical protein
MQETYHEEDYKQLRNVLEQLCKDAGYTNPELARLIHTVEQQALELGRIHALEAENGRLKQEVKRWRDLYYTKTVSTMSTKLKDALRE